MTETGRDDENTPREPSGFGKRSHGLAAEYAQEQGWGTEEEQRTKLAGDATESSGGTDYDYGAQDFGDTPENEQGVKPSPETVTFLTGKKKA